MRPGNSSAVTGAEPGVVGAGDTAGATGRRPWLKLASAVMFVTELDRSVAFYSELLAWDVAVRDDPVALLASPDGFQLYLLGRGPNTPHPLGQVGIQYLLWTADDEDDLRRCERVLKAQSAQVTTQTGDGFTVVEGRGPDNVPVLVTYPGPDEAQRHRIKQRIYAW
jgi:catechol 2,3-dioxygenase-like lactoylglutathione lyase family enzyme